jgi:hypothetical protein
MSPMPEASPLSKKSCPSEPPAEEVHGRHVVGGGERQHGRVDPRVHLDALDGHGQADVEVVRHAVVGEQGQGAGVEAQEEVRVDEVAFEVVVAGDVEVGQRELDGALVQLVALEAVPRRVRVAAADGQLALARRDRALGEQRTEGLGRAVERAQRGVELEREAARRRAQGEARELVGDVLVQEAQGLGGARLRDEVGRVVGVGQDQRVGRREESRQELGQGNILRPARLRGQDDEGARAHDHVGQSTHRHSLLARSKLSEPGERLAPGWKSQIPAAFASSCVRLVDTPGSGR